MILEFIKYTEEPKVNDYVMVNETHSYNAELDDYFLNVVGKLVEINIIENLYYVHFSDLPADLYEIILDKEPYRRKNIIAWGKTIEECKIHNQTNKYNL